MGVDKIEIKGDVYGAVNNEGVINQIFNILDHTKETEKEKFYQQWWFVSLILALLVGSLTWWSFESIELGLVVFAVAFFLTMFFNPKKRFYRIGITTLVTVSIINFIPSISAIIPLKENSLIYDTLIQLDTSSTTSMNITLVIFSALMFVLDLIIHLKNK